MAKVIIVDDDPQVRKVLELTLAKAGHDTAAAANGVEALKICQQSQWDVLVTDIVMPDKEGIETIIEVTEQFPDMKIIAISGGGRISAADHLDSAKLFGAHRTLAKPFDRKELLKVIDELL